MRVEVSNNFPGRVDPVADSAEAGLRFSQNPVETLLAWEFNCNQ